MNRLLILKSALAGGASVLALSSPAAAKMFDIPNGDLAVALGAYMRQSGVEIVYLDDVVRGHKSPGARGDFTETAALTQILRGTGFTTKAMMSNTIGIVPAQREPRPEEVRVAQTRRAPAAPLAPAQAGVETVVVTAQKKSENIQNVPIAITALSQAQLTERQVAGGPDLVKEVPNLTFSKTNFTGYNIEIRGIGTQAISVTTDPAVAVAFNGTPFIRNHFFEQEFYDLSDVEVLRGPQGTLYGRNATAGVVNIKSALPNDQYEAMLSADLGNFSNRRLEGMLNVPIVGDKLDLRVAGEWTKRDGYSFNQITGQPIDGRDLWSTRVTLTFKPNSDLQSTFVWEHFQEDDDRMRTAKQLCKTDYPPEVLDGMQFNVPLNVGSSDYVRALSQGCSQVSLYSPQAFQVPYSWALPIFSAAQIVGVLNTSFAPYSSTTQSTNLRVIESNLNPVYRAKNDTFEWNTDYQITPELTFTSQTGFNHDFLWSTEDYNRFNSPSGAFINSDDSALAGYTFPDPAAGTNGISPGSGIFCDPQVGCSDRVVTQDLSNEKAWQLSQEFRLTSNFSGPLNFSFGGNFLHYETEENYYVFANTLTLFALQNMSQVAAGCLQASNCSPAALAAGGIPYTPGISDNHQCMPLGFQLPDPGAPNFVNNADGACPYIDPNSLSNLNNEGHNYFLSQNPYKLNSYAAFGEAYYNILSDLKLTTGLRWTEDQKHFIDIPSEVGVTGYGYPITGVVDQQWDQFTGRAALDWTPSLNFTDQTLFYGTYAHGYKAGGANPPGAVFLQAVGGLGQPATTVHPVTFKPEFIEAFELGTKNTLLDNSLTIDADVFYYNYTGYQISEIVDRTAINNNYNAHVEGAELESRYEPLPGLRFNFAGGWENTALAGGTKGVDLMDRTAGHAGWVVAKRFPTQASNCVLPEYVFAATIVYSARFLDTNCDAAYNAHLDPVTGLPYTPYPLGTGTQPPNPNFPNIPANINPYPGFDPLSVDPNAPANVNNGLGLPPNNGEGFDKNLSGNKLPNAPPFTVSFGAEYTLPVSEDWAATLRGDYYWQDYSWARVFNDNPYDRIRGYTNVNLALILTSANGWQVMGYIKNVFNVTAITGDFLNSDDSGLTTNVFLTDPRLIGVRVTKQLDGNDGFWGSDYSGSDFFTNLFSDTDGGKPPLWIDVGTQMEAADGFIHPLEVPFASELVGDGFRSPAAVQRPLSMSFGEEAAISFQPDNTDWILSASVRFGRALGGNKFHAQAPDKPVHLHLGSYGGGYLTPVHVRYEDIQAQNSEHHAIVDFDIGKDVGLGMFGLEGESAVSAGIRIAQFSSQQSLNLHADPDYYLPSSLLVPHSRHAYAVTSRQKRSFHGIGPSISWKASADVTGAPENGVLAFDWGANAGILFGRQRMIGQHQTLGTFVKTGVFPKYHFSSHPHRTGSPNRSRMVAVPNLGGFLGLSYRFTNAKISFGYRADEFFGAMDGGIDTRKSENVGFFGPYAKISVGLGG